MHAFKFCISPASIEMLIIWGEKWSFSTHFNVSQFCERCSAGSSENENVFYFRARVFNIRHHLQLTPSFIFSNTIIPKLRPQISFKYFSKFQKTFLIHMPFKNRPLVSEPPSCKSFQFIMGFKLHFPTNEWPKLKNHLLLDEWAKLTTFSPNLLHQHI